MATAYPVKENIQSWPVWTAIRLQAFFTPRPKPKTQHASCNR